jgi:cytochrome c-type biogenesis protein CcmE
VTPRRRRRLLLVVLLLAGLSAAAALMLTAFRENLLYFYAPSEVLAGEAPAGARFRVGGLVEEGSVTRIGDGLTVRFVLADCTAGMPVRYTGILPDLFREGQGIVAYGRVDEQGRFVADEVLAKHDENYMPKEVADSLQTEDGSSCMPAGMGTS